MEHIRTRLQTEEERKHRFAKPPLRQLRAKPAADPLDEFTELRRILREAGYPNKRQPQPDKMEVAIEVLTPYAIWIWKFLTVYWGWTAIMAGVLLLAGHSFLSIFISIVLFAIVFLFHAATHRVFAAFLELGFSIGSGITALKLPPAPNAESRFQVRRNDV